MAKAQLFEDVVEQVATIKETGTHLCQSDASRPRIAEPGKSAMLSAPPTKKSGHTHHGRYGFLPISMRTESLFFTVVSNIRKSLEIPA